MFKPPSRFYTASPASVGLGVSRYPTAERAARGMNRMTNNAAHRKAELPDMLGVARRDRVGIGGGYR